MHGFGQGYVIIFTEEINLGCITKIILRITGKKTDKCPSILEIPAYSNSTFVKYACIS